MCTQISDSQFIREKRLLFVKSRSNEKITGVSPVWAKYEGLKSGIVLKERFILFILKSTIEIGDANFTHESGVHGSKVLNFTISFYTLK